MMLDSEQKAVVRGVALAVAFSSAFLGIGYAWIPMRPDALPGVAERLAYALQADVFVLLWLLAAVAKVGNARFFSPADIQGSGLTTPSDRLAVPLAVLQNTLEQSLLAVGAHLALAAVLRGREMVLIPLLVVLFCVGRAAFWAGYRRGAGGRAFGFATTFYPTVASYALALALLVVR